MSVNKIAGSSWTLTFYLVHDNRLFQSAKTIFVLFMVKNAAVVGKFHFAMFCIP